MSSRKVVMAVTWHVHPLTGGHWQVLTPSLTQACGIHATEQEAVGAACTRLSDEGGGSVAIHSDTGGVVRTVTVAAGQSPMVRPPALAD